LSGSGHSCNATDGSNLRMSREPYSCASILNPSSSDLQYLLSFNSIMSALEVYKAIVEAQTLQLPLKQDAPIFTRNLEQRLDGRRKSERLYAPKRPREVVDFSSNDFLSISSSGLLRSAFLEEMAQHPEMDIGTAASRLLDGNSEYVENLEREIASFHGAETALMFGSGYEANISIYEVIPLPGDMIVYDELVHASIHNGIRNSRASIKKSFSHNNPTSLAATLSDLRENNEAVRLGMQTIIIAVESVYSMDGTVAPLVEFVTVLEDLFPLKNWEIVIDEAHSTGLVGKNGRGLVCALGLEDKIAIRLHTCGKGLGCTGGQSTGHLLGDIDTWRLTFCLTSCCLVQRHRPEHALELCALHHLFNITHLSHSCGDTSSVQDAYEW